MTDAPKYPRLALEFPDYDQATLPVIPAMFEDSSWHNNSAPSFESRALRLSIWMDYESPDMREHEGGRFILNRLDDDGAFTNDNGDLTTDDWGEVLPYILAAAFAAELESYLTPEQWAEMRATNRTVDPIECASHDYCDANVFMAEAFKKVTGRESLTSWETGADGKPLDAAEAAKAEQCEIDNALWNAAWDIAKRDYLTAAAPAWIVGAEVEWSNGRVAVVLFADGEKAVLYDPFGAQYSRFIPAHGNPDQWVIAGEDERIHSTFPNALAALKES